MVLELLLLLKLRFVLGIVSSAFFQVEVGGRSLLWPVRVFFWCPAAVVAFAAAAVPPLLLRYECFSASYFVIKEEIKNNEFETLLLLLLLLSQAGESRGVVGTMVLLELLLLLKLRFVLGIVSSAFFQVEVGGRSLVRPV